VGGDILAQYPQEIKQEEKGIEGTSLVSENEHALS